MHRWLIFFYLSENMRIKTIIITIFLLGFLQISIAQKVKTDANIIGHVVCCEEHIPFATISIKGTTIGKTADESGHYHLINCPEGELTVVAQALGYKPQEIKITIKAGETKEVNFELEKDVLNLEEVVVTGNRHETNRKESSTIVNTITPIQFNTTQSITVGEGLNFSPGLRMENNCQNCGFSQVRMNGMEGPYSQILINSRPIFSGLAGVYGLELIPSNMIERIEIIRGGGSVLYGGNAIAGTINLILKDPISNSYELGLSSGLIGVGMNESGGISQDYSVNFNTSLVSADNKTGMSLYGFYRNRQPFDANDDDFSEIALMKNLSVGTRFFHRIGTRSKIIADFFNIREKRRGGNKFDYLNHEADISESLEHNLTTGALTYEQFFRESDLFSIYVSGQGVSRDSYYGANQSLSDYGHTDDFTYAIGTQYTAMFKKSNLVVGIENDGAWLKDKKLGYPDIENAEVLPDSTIYIPHVDNVTIADEASVTTGVFAQYEISWKALLISAGLRYDHYEIIDNAEHHTGKNGDVLSPRLTLKYDINEFLQARVSYSQGYRAPQIFDEDLHVEASGCRRVVHQNSPDLKQETSNSFMASVDFNKLIGTVYFGLLIEGFYNQLNDAFAAEIIGPDSCGVITYLRVNSNGKATVQGVNMELNIAPLEKITFQTGFTFQSSMYDEPQEFDEKKFFRTPDSYGYFTFDWTPTKKWGVSATGNYTGAMLVPYFGTAIPNPEVGELRVSKSFFDMGVKLRYNMKLNGATLQLYTGVKNLFNSYQDDFDSGIDRDPGYIYGPMNPRTIYFGIKVGNFIK